MQLTFVGTGSGKTSLKRFHSSILISSGNHNLLIDAGDGTSKALLKLGIDYKGIDTILFSHYHADHFGGIASLFTQMKIAGRTKALTFVTHKLLINALKNFIDSTYMFFEIAGFDVKIIGFEFNESYQISESIKFIPRQNHHIRQKDKVINKNIPFISSGFYFEVEDMNFVYTSDVGNADDLLLFKEKKIDFLITETTHISTDDILGAYQILKPDKVYLTHIDDEDENKLLIWLQNLDEVERGKFILAEDGLTITAF
ncbi:ribonuclease Z [bacterium BMS3Abin04]|nr:ribonuclease Z [bacterium BMS3Abin04]